MYFCNYSGHGVSLLPQGNHTVFVVDSNQNNKECLRTYVGPCPYCGFQLQRPKTDLCSECGNTLEITLKPPFVVTGWLIAFAGIWSSTVIYLAHIGFLLVGGYACGGHVGWKPLIFELFALLILVMFARIWLGLHRWVHERSAKARWSIGFIGCLLPFLMYFLMMAVISF